MLRAIIILLAALTVSGCANTIPDRAYLNRVVMETPRDWNIPAEKVPEIRAKAIGFIANYATLGLGDVSDDMVSSIHASGGEGGYNYIVRIVPVGDQARILVKCWSSGGRLTTIDTIRNAGILANYLQTGTIRPVYISR